MKPPRKARKLNRQKVLDLHAKGVPPTQIAQLEGVARSTVWRFLELSKPERNALEVFKQHRGDVLARIGAKSLDVQEKILNTLDDVTVTSLTPSQKSGLLHVLNAQSGTLFDKERLERGQSTENHSVMHRILGAAFDGVHNPSITKGSENASK